MIVTAEDPDKWVTDTSKKLADPFSRITKQNIQEFGVFVIDLI